MRLGAINHVALCVSDLDRSMAFYTPILEFLGYAHSESLEDVEIWESQGTGTAVNLWQAKPEHLDATHYDYAPGIHHLAFNATERAQVDELYELLGALSADVVDPPAHYDYAPGYYSVFFRDPDGIRIELAYIPGSSVPTKA